MKDRLEDLEAQGWVVPLESVWVCSSHVTDPFLQARVRDAAEECVCDYCDREGEDGEAIACDLGVIVTCYGEVLRSRWNRAEQELPFDQEDGSYLGSYSDAEDILVHGERLFDGVSPDELVRDILRCFPSDNAWCEKDYFRLNPREALSAGWDQFCRTVKHEKRFLFLVEDGPIEDDDYDGVPVSRMLQRLGELVEREGLLCRSPAGTAWVRARAMKPGDVFTTAKDLGTTPLELAKQSNRMSPSGIPMFYGAAEDTAALAETVEQGSPATLGMFQTTTDLLLLKLTELPPLPSFFDIDQLQRWYALRFLGEFTKDLSKSIEKDGREHVEYVPTQIVTEFFRRAFETSDGSRINGIIYPSSLTDGGTCVVLFVENDQCCDSADDDEAMLALVGVKYSNG